jgi:hypothetical protein
MLDFMRGSLTFPAASEWPLEVYLDWGRYDLRSSVEAWNMVVVNEELSATLREHGYRPTGGERPVGPGWSVWSQRDPALLLALFPAKKR